MCPCQVQNATDMALLCVRWPEHIGTRCQPNSAISIQFDDHANPLVSAMHVWRIVVSRIHTKRDPIELVRSRARMIRPIGWTCLSLHCRQRLLQIRD